VRTVSSRYAHPAIEFTIKTEPASSTHGKGRTENKTRPKTPTHKGTLSSRAARCPNRQLSTSNDLLENRPKWPLAGSDPNHSGKVSAEQLGRDHRNRYKQIIVIQQKARAMPGSAVDETFDDAAQTEGRRISRATPAKYAMRASTNRPTCIGRHAARWHDGKVDIHFQPLRKNPDPAAQDA